MQGGGQHRRPTGGQLKTCKNLARKKFVCFVHSDSTFYQDVLEGGGDGHAFLFNCIIFCLLVGFEPLRGRSSDQETERKFVDGNVFS